LANTSARFEDLLSSKDAQGPGPSRDIYALMGEDNLYKLMSDFYVELGKSEVRPLFPQDLEAASRKSAAFFIGLLGGPPIYVEKYGSPRMRARHLPFEIDERARQVWLSCFGRVLGMRKGSTGFLRSTCRGSRIFWRASQNGWSIRPEATALRPGILLPRSGINPEPHIISGDGFRHSLHRQIELFMVGVYVKPFPEDVVWR
jgi:truncated hemoglobin YjbI